MTDPKPGIGSEPQIDPRQMLKMGIDLAPLLVFFVVYLISGIYWATAFLMAATVLALLASWCLLKHVSTTLIVTTVLVVVFGSLTLWFNDPRFIKIKPTIVNLLFAAILFGGVLAGKPLLRYLLGEALQMTDAGWRLLSIRFGFFFLAMAGLNEFLWRNFSETVWASFKVFGILPLTVVFFALQYGLIQKHQISVSDGSTSAQR